MTRAIVVGSGMAGLTAAAYLAKDGCQVDVYEQADHIGGVTATIGKDGYSWDLGPMALEGFGPGEPAAILLQELGCYDRIDPIRGDRGLYFPDYEVSRSDQYLGPDWRKEKLKQVFPEEADAIDRFYRFLETSLDLITLERQAVIASPPRSTLIKAVMYLQFRRIKKYADWDSKQLMDHFFSDPKLKFFFLAILADMTILPTEYPALGIPFSNQETAYDRRVPRKRALGIGPPAISYSFIEGGCGRLVEALAALIREKGGKLRTGTPVKRILLEGNRVKGVQLRDGAEHQAEVVLVSGDARGCFFGMIGRDKLPSDLASAIDAIPLMESVHMVHLGVDMDPTPHQPVPLNYYYGTYDIEDSVHKLRSGAYHHGEAGFLIYIPSMHSPGMAPEGKHAITVYTIAPNAIQGDWKSEREKWTEKLLISAERIIPGLREHAEVTVALTPKDFGELVHMPDHHSFGGTCPKIGGKGAPHRTPYQGLWFIGSQSETGPGVWTQIISSRNVFRSLRKEI